jgi:sulfoxide reductase catalytic subunit YedY
VERQPVTSWMKNWPEAYGFYSNVNPSVAHPNHSQATETRLPSLFKSIRTEMFNGYGDQVARLYTGMDLRKNY